MTAAHPDPHVVLGVSPDAPIEEVRLAYRRRMRALHPDQGGADDLAAHAEIAAVTEAWRLLSSDPIGRSGTRSFDPPPETGEAWADRQREWSGENHGAESGPAPRMLRIFLVVTVVLLLVWTVIFIVIAFSQSG